MDLRLRGLPGEPLAQRCPATFSHCRFGHPHNFAFRQYAGQHISSRSGGLILRRQSSLGSAFDVFIAGAGPAGTATAISLQALAPGLRVCLADAGRAELFRIGESVPPLIRRFLDHLGVWTIFVRDGHCPSFRNLSAWGGPDLISHEFLLDVYNTGWRLDRLRFDRMLTEEAVNRGAHLLKTQVRKITFANGGWTLDCDDAVTYEARCVVDATGRNSLLSRLAGFKPVNYDRLVASAVLVETSKNYDRPGADEVLIESFRDGWWYTTAIPGGCRVATVLTDADIARHLHLYQLQDWMTCLRATRHVRHMFVGGQPLAPPKLWPAGSRCLEGAAQPGLIAVGDAMSSFDPLSSQGIIKALRSAIFASYAIADLLQRSDEQSLARHWALMKREFFSYRKTLWSYYHQEQRWPDAPFWHRRHVQFR